MRIERTKMLEHYFVKFIIRLSIFVGVFLFYLWNKELMCEIMTYPIYQGINPIHVLWLVFMLIMLRHLFPTRGLTMALLKGQSKPYERAEHKEVELLRFVQDQNVKAWRVMLIWLFLNGVIGLLYLFKTIDEADLLMITVFFFLCDYLCILFFCPFQTFVMKNRCCVNCRIYDWGHFMMFTPMLFIRNFFSWSLFFTSLVVLLHWELVYAKHPERFWSGSNRRIQCAHCKDKTCQVKTLIREGVALERRK